MLDLCATLCYGFVLLMPRLRGRFHSARLGHEAIPMALRIRAVPVPLGWQVGLPARAYGFAVLAMYVAALTAEGMINLITKLT